MAGEPVSFVVNGVTYSWTGIHADCMRGYQPFVDPAPAPQWLYELAEKLGGIGSDGTRTERAEPLGEGELIPEGRRDTILTSMAGTMRRRGFCEEAICAALLSENELRCDPPLLEEQITKIAKSVARYEPDPFADVVVKHGGGGVNGHTERGQIIRVPASQLRRLATTEKWLWKGIIPAETVTILSALPKAGKTTLLAHLLRAVEQGGQFCGQDIRHARVVYVTEESETIWAERRDKLGLKDHCEFVLRPFRSKPTMREWRSFIDDLIASLKERPADMVVLDTLAKLWPVKNENDASEVTDVLTPLLEVAYGMKAVLVLIHHLRKSDGLESTGTRGSGGITAAVDCILELRRYKPNDRKDRRRVLHCDSRFEDRLDECVIQLADDGINYVACGDKRDTARDDCVLLVQQVLAQDERGHYPPGMTQEQIVGSGWENEPAPRKETILDALRYGVEASAWNREGRGTKGHPYTYWRPLDPPG